MTLSAPELMAAPLMSTCPPAPPVEEARMAPSVFTAVAPLMVTRPPSDPPVAEITELAPAFTVPPSIPTNPPAPDPSAVTVPSTLITLEGVPWRRTVPPAPLTPFAETLESPPTVMEEVWSGEPIWMNPPLAPSALTLELPMILMTSPSMVMVPPSWPASPSASIVPSTLSITPPIPASMRISPPTPPRPRAWRVPVFSMRPPTVPSPAALRVMRPPERFTAVARTMPVF